jgi:hypothetical protein
MAGRLALPIELEADRKLFQMEYAGGKVILGAGKPGRKRGERPGLRLAI